MERGEDAEKMAVAYRENQPKFEGKRLLVYVSRKYKQLKHGSVLLLDHPPAWEIEFLKHLSGLPEKSNMKYMYFFRHRPPSPESEEKRASKRERPEESETQSSSSSKGTIKKDEEPSPKKVKVEKPATDKPEEVKESQSDPLETVPEVKNDLEEEQSTETPEAQKMETEPVSDIFF